MIKRLFTDPMLLVRTFTAGELTKYDVSSNRNGLEFIEKI